MAHVVAALMFLPATRQCFYLVEQPADSIMFEFPAIASAMEATQGVVYTTYQYYWGTKLAKGTLLLTNLPEDIISGIARPKPKLERGASSSFWKDDGKWTEGSRVVTMGPCAESGEASDHQILGCVFAKRTQFSDDGMRAPCRWCGGSGVIRGLWQKPLITYCKQSRRFFVPHPHILLGSN